jgi:hypothetical protein
MRWPETVLLGFAQPPGCAALGNSVKESPSLAASPAVVNDEPVQSTQHIEADMSIERDGFLTADIGDRIKKIRQQHAKWFDFATRINPTCQQSLRSAIPGHGAARTNEPLLLRQRIAFPLLHRCVAGFQGVILLAERGMFHEARCVARMMLEALFSLAALRRDEHFAEEFLDLFPIAKKKLLAKAIELARTPDHVRTDLLEQAREQLAEIATEIRSRGIKELRTEDIAKRAGMHLYYLTQYSLLSETVHSNVRDLERHYLETRTATSVISGGNRVSMTCMKLSAAPAFGCLTPLAQPSSYSSKRRCKIKSPVCGTTATTCRGAKGRGLWHAIARPG